MPILLLVLSSLVLASYTVNQNSFSFNGEPTKAYSNTFTIRNDYPDYNLTGFNHTFEKNTDLPANSLNTDSVIITTSFPGELGIGSSEESINFEFTMPTGLDAISEDFSEITWDAGDLILGANAHNTTNQTSIETFSVLVPITINVKIDNSLQFYRDRVEVEVSSEDPENVSEGRTVDVYDGEQVSIKINYENTFTENGLTFDKEDIEVLLFVDDEEVDAQYGEDSVDDGEIGEVSVDFEVEDYDIGEKYDVRLELFGFENQGGMHGEIFGFEIDINEIEEDNGPAFVPDSDGDGVNDDLDLCPGTSILCDVDEAGCEIDLDNDGICNGVDRTPTGEVRVEEQTTNQNSNTEEENNKESVEKEEVVIVEKETNDGGIGSFIFGLIVGFIGAILFCTLTKV